MSVLWISPDHARTMIDMAIETISVSKLRAEAELAAESESTFSSTAVEGLKGSAIPVVAVGADAGDVRVVKAVSMTTDATSVLSLRPLAPRSSFPVSQRVELITAAV